MITWSENTVFISVNTEIYYIWKKMSNTAKIISKILTGIFSTYIKNYYQYFVPIYI